MATGSRVYKRFVWSHEVEDLEYYQKGGYYPITISDKLQSPRTTYVVLDKLGFGRSSTVWLAQDTQTSLLVALKIGIAASRSNELAIRKRLIARIPPNNRWVFSIYFLPLLDSFEVESPNGTHTCLIMEPLGPSIFDVCKHYAPHRLPGLMALKVARQLTQVVGYLRTHGIVHGGWLHLLLRPSLVC
jgi:serine/threonine-protein kinase SRPK3